MPMVGASLRGMPASCFHFPLGVCFSRRVWDWLYLQFHQGETSPGSSAAVVFDRGTSDDRSEFVHRSRGDAGGLGETGGSTARLSTRLIEVDTHTALPVFVEVRGVDCVVVLDRLCTEIEVSHFSQCHEKLGPAERLAG